MIKEKNKKCDEKKFLPSVLVEDLKSTMPWIL